MTYGMSLQWPVKVAEPFRTSTRGVFIVIFRQENWDVRAFWSGRPQTRRAKLDQVTKCFTKTTHDAPASIRNGVSHVCGEMASDKVMAIGNTARAARS